MSMVYGLCIYVYGVWSMYIGLWCMVYVYRSMVGQLTDLGEQGSELQDLLFSLGLFFLSQKWLKTTEWSTCFLQTTCCSCAPVEPT